MEKISIALAAYNGEKYIITQLESILNQTLKPNEVIIVDDCSTDHTVDLVNDFITQNNLSNWKLYRNEINSGYKKNFYNAISKTTGDYIFLSDQDDEWHSNKIERMINVIKNNANIEALNSGTKLIDGNSNTIEYKCQKNYYNNDFLYFKNSLKDLQSFDDAYILLHNISPGCTMAITRNLANDFLKTYSFELPHDWYLNLLASQKNKCYFLNEVLIDYRRHENNAIGANTGMVKGITKKTSDFRILNYQSRLDSINQILEYYHVMPTKGLIESKNLIEEIIAFYKCPSLRKLIHLRKNPLYFELAKRKVRVWEFIVSIRLDKFIIKLFS